MESDHALSNSIPTFPDVILSLVRRVIQLLQTVIMQTSSLVGVDEVAEVVGDHLDTVEMASYNQLGKMVP